MSTTKKSIKLSDLKGELLEWNWIDNLIDQAKFFNDNSAYYHVRLVVKKYCDCYPDCYHSDDNDNDDVLEHKKEVVAA